MATIRKRSGRWQAMIRRSGHPQIRKTFTTKSDCVKWAREMESQIERRLHLPEQSHAKLTLGDLFERYCQEHMPRPQGRFSEGYRLRMLTERLGYLKLAEAHYHALSAYRDNRLREVCPASVKREVALILRVMRIAALEWDIHLPRGVPNVRMPKVANGRNRRVSDEELESLLAHTESPVFALVIRFALATGMRRGEIVNARWSDVDITERTIHIPITKTDIERYIPLTEKAMIDIQELDECHSEFLFPVKANSISQAFRRACKRADLKNLHFHDLRHEAVTRFFEIGLSIPEVASISGHRDYKMLERNTHISRKHLSDRIDKLFAV